MTRKHSHWTLGGILFVLATVSTSPAGAQLDAARIGWSQISLQASKVGFKINSVIELESAPAKGELIAAGEHPALPPRHARSQLLTIDSRGVGQHSSVRFWFEAQDARALQRSELSTSRKRRKHRTYRYASDGVFVISKRPADGEDDLPHAQWTDVSDGFTEYPPDLDRGLAITEPSALFYILPASTLAVGDKSQVNLYSKGRVNPVEIEVKGREKIKVNYIETSAGGEREIGGPVEAIRVAVRPRLPEGESKSNFKMLGLDGDIDLFFDPKTRVLLLMTGKVAIAGRVKLRLRAAVVE